MKLLIIVLALSLNLANGQAPPVDIDEQNTIMTPDPSNMVPPQAISLPENEINQQYLERVQEKDRKTTTEGNINKWIADELNEMKNQKMYSNIESFAVHLKPAQLFEFKWNLGHPETNRKTFSLIVSIFTYSAGDDPSAISNHDEDNYVEVESKSVFFAPYNPLGKIYVLRELSVFFQKNSKFIRLTNNHQVPVLVQLQMEKEPQQIATVAAGAVKNQDFILASQKLQTIFDQYQQSMKSESRMNKWEWGFLEKEERYDQEMLKLTALELIVILVTSIVQMYCIKHLFDNKQII